MFNCLCNMSATHSAMTLVSRLCLDAMPDHTGVTSFLMGNLMMPIDLSMRALVLGESLWTHISTMSTPHKKSIRYATPDRSQHRHVHPSWPPGPTHHPSLMHPSRPSRAHAQPRRLSKLAMDARTTSVAPTTSEFRPEPLGQIAVPMATFCGASWRPRYRCCAIASACFFF